MKSRNKGFTLIELLVVIAIIAILAAILFPVFNQARRTAHKAACQSNLKQIGTAISMYMQDYDEKYPGGIPRSFNGSLIDPLDCQTMASRGTFAGWVGNLLMPYTQNFQIYQCPTNLGESSNLVNNWDQCLRLRLAPFAFTGYAYNYISLWNQPSSLIVRSASQLLMWDGATAWADCPYMSSCGIWTQREVPVFLAKEGKALVTGMQDPGANGWFLRRHLEVPHVGQANYLFADGHVLATNWGRLTWGQLDVFIPTAHPDWDVFITNRTAQVWPGQ